MEELKNIALLIDAENTRLARLEAVVYEVAARGRLVVKRAYANWRKDSLKNWEPKLKLLGIKAEQQFDYVTGKNTSDIALIIGAMQLLNQSIYDAFVIVSSDSDFTPLVIALREAGAYVIGAGELQTPDPFINSCDEFIFLENAGYSDIHTEAAAKKPALKKSAAVLREQAKRLIEKREAEQRAAAAKREAERRAAAEKREAERRAAEAKLEAETRAFFGKHFKKQIYREKKEEIIRAVAVSRSKLQVNNNLMKLFESEEVRIIYHRLEPIIKDLPGQ